MYSYILIRAHALRTQAQAIYLATISSIFLLCIATLCPEPFAKMISQAKLYTTKIAFMPRKKRDSCIERGKKAQEKSLVFFSANNQAHFMRGAARGTKRVRKCCMI